MLRMVQHWNGVHHLRESSRDKSQKGQDVGIDIDEAAQEGAIDTGGFNEDKGLKLLEDVSGGHLKALLLDLTLEQIVNKQGEHVDENHGSDALVLVQEEWGNL